MGWPKLATDRCQVANCFFKSDHETDLILGRTKLDNFEWPALKNLKLFNNSNPVHFLKMVPKTG